MSVQLCVFSTHVLRMFERPGSGLLGLFGARRIVVDWGRHRMEKVFKKAQHVIAMEAAPICDESAMFEPRGAALLSFPTKPDPPHTNKAAAPVRLAAL